MSRKTKRKSELALSSIFHTVSYSLAILVLGMAGGYYLSFCQNSINYFDEEYNKSASEKNLRIIVSHLSEVS